MRVPKSIRRVTDPIMERVPVPIRGGVNRGRLWSLVSAGSGYWSGRRGHRQMRLMERLIGPGDVVWDVGAHHGYVSLAAARLVGGNGEVHAFEPDSRNRRILQRHLAWNRVGNADVHSCALSSFEGEADFGGGTTSKMGALGLGGERVEVRTADGLVESGERRAPDFMKIDVEGAEGEVIEGAARSLSPTARLLIAVHTPEADRKCVSQLTRLGFDLIPSRGLLVARKGTWRGDPDLLCVGPESLVRDTLQQELLDAGFPPHA